MQRKNNIKWRSSDAEKLEKEVQRFNSKVYYNRKKHPELENILPKPITAKDKKIMVQEIKQAPRSEYRKQLNSLDRFTRKGAEEVIVSKTGNAVTKWEKNEVRLKVNQINRDRAVERKKIEQVPVVSQGKAVGLKRGEMETERMKELQPKKFDFDKIKGGKEWEKFKESVDKQASIEYKMGKNDMYKEHYIQALETAFGSTGDVLDLIEKIQDIPSDVFVEQYYSDQEATIDFIYDPLERQAKFNVIYKIWTGNDFDELGEIDETDG